MIPGLQMEKQHRGAHCRPRVKPVVSMGAGIQIQMCLSPEVEILALRHLASHRFGKLCLFLGTGGDHRWLSPQTKTPWFVVSSWPLSPVYPFWTRRGIQALMRAFLTPHGSLSRLLAVPAHRSPRPALVCTVPSLCPCRCPRRTVPGSLGPTAAS